MGDEFVQHEWEKLLKRLDRCAENLSESADTRETYSEAIAEFRSRPAPQRYPDLLKCVAEGAELAKRWQGSRTQPQQATQPRPDEDLVDEASEESFPASDPPSWSPAHA